jgi:hypothetical protein
MKNIPQAYRPSYLGGGSVISAGTIHDLRRVEVPAHFETPEYISILLQSYSTYF